MISTLQYYYHMLDAIVSLILDDKSKGKKFSNQLLHAL